MSQECDGCKKLSYSKADNYKLEDVDRKIRNCEESLRRVKGEKQYLEERVDKLERELVEVVSRLDAMDGRV